MSPKPSLGGKSCQSGFRVDASQTLIVESAEALISQVFLSSVTACRARTLPVCPRRSHWCLRLLLRQTAILPDGSPTKTYLGVCAIQSALDSGRLMVETSEMAAYARFCPQNVMFVKHMAPPAHWKLEGRSQRLLWQ